MNCSFLRSSEPLFERGKWDFLFRYCTEYFSRILCLPPECVGDVDGTVQVGGEHGSRQPVVVPVQCTHIRDEFLNAIFC